eukprot:9479615-Pyramimonas_sp.AAC.2
MENQRQLRLKLQSMLKVTQKNRDSRSLVTALTRFLSVHHKSVIALLQAAELVLAAYTCTDPDLVRTLVCSIEYAGYTVELPSSLSTTTSSGDYTIVKVVSEDKPNVLTNDVTASDFIENIHASLSDADTFLGDRLLQEASWLLQEKLPIERGDSVMNQELCS